MFTKYLVAFTKVLSILYLIPVTILDYYLLLTALLEIPAFIYVSQSCMQMVFRIAFQLHNIVVSTPALSLQVLECKVYSIYRY